MANEFQNLQQAVKDNNDEIDSAIVLIVGIKGQLDAAIQSNNPAALQALSDSLGTEKEKLAAAILANTPSDPATTTQP